MHSDNHGVVRDIEQAAKAIASLYVLVSKREIKGRFRLEKFFEDIEFKIERASEDIDVTVDDLYPGCIGPLEFARAFLYDGETAHHEIIAGLVDPPIDRRGNHDELVITVGEHVAKLPHLLEELA
jgi:hypothetical protein